MLYCVGETLLFREGDNMCNLQASKRGPHRPSHSVLELQAMTTNFEYSLDPVQARIDHQNDERMNAFRLNVVLWAAGLDPNWDHTGPRNHLIAQIADRVNPELPAIKIFANEHLRPSW